MRRAAVTSSHRQIACKSPAPPKLGRRSFRAKPCRVAIAHQVSGLSTVNRRGCSSSGDFALACGLAPVPCPLELGPEYLATACNSTGHKSVITTVTVNSAGKRVSRQIDTGLDGRGGTGVSATMLQQFQARVDSFAGLGRYFEYFHSRADGADVGSRRSFIKFHCDREI